MRESDKSRGTEASELVNAVEELTKVVVALNTLLERDYPKREEIEQKFTSRQNSRKRLMAVVIGGISAIIISYFFSISTVVYCFHDGEPGNRYRPICSVFPGYEITQGGNNRIISEFAELQEQVRQQGVLLNEINDKLGEKK